MTEKFELMGYASWALRESFIEYGNTTIPYENIIETKLVKSGIDKITVICTNKTYDLMIPYSKMKSIDSVYEMLGKLVFNFEELKKDKLIAIQEQELAIEKELGVIYKIKGARGRVLTVFENRCLIKVDITFGSLITGNATDGEKTIFYADCNGVQFKECGISLGDLQLETSSGLMNNRSSNFFNENTFTFDSGTISNKEMQEVCNYIKEQISGYKNNTIKNMVETQSKSLAEELKELHSLIGLGILTQEEFDKQKEKLLNI